VRTPLALFTLSASSLGLSVDFCYALFHSFGLSVWAKALSQGVSAALYTLLADGAYPAELTDRKRYHSILSRGPEKRLGIRSHFLGMKLYELGVHLGWGP
jgi:hypothetical protein